MLNVFFNAQPCFNFDIYFRTNSTDKTEINSNINNDNNHN